MPDGSNTTFKDDGNGGFECLNAHSTMTKSGNEYTITNAAQSQYHFNADGELDWVKDAEGNISNHLFHVQQPENCNGFHRQNLHDYLQWQ